MHELLRGNLRGVVGIGDLLDLHRGDLPAVVWRIIVLELPDRDLFLVVG